MLLDIDLIPDPSVHNLLLRVGRDRLDVGIYSVVQDNSFIHRSFPLSAIGGSMEKSLREVVYDNPLLLGEFRRVYVVIESGELMVLPAEASAPEQVRALFMAAHPDYDGEILTDTTSTHNAVITYGIPSDLLGFLRRTFHAATLMSHLTPLCRYFAAKPAGRAGSRMVCNFRPSAMDVIVTRGANLVLANTFYFNSPNDAVYYILAVREALGIDNRTEEVQLAGSAQVREAVAPELRRFVQQVMPVLFPTQMFKAGREAMRAPFDLILTPICE